MSKKQQITKNNKPLSKHSDINRDKNIYSYKQLPQTSDITQINYIQKRLNQQIHAREESYDQLLQMIRILDQTKKSKVPANFQKLSGKKLLGPNRQTTLENQDLNQIKAEIAEIHSLKQLDEQQNRDKLLQIQKQIRLIKNKFQQMEGFKINIMHINEQLSLMKQSTHQVHQRMQQQLQSQNLSSTIQFLQQKINNQYMLVKTLSTQITKMQSNIDNLDHSIKYMNSSLQSIENCMNDQFIKIQQKVNKTSILISETKNNIESIFLGSSKKEGNSTSSNNLYQITENIVHINTRMSGLERRMDLIYHQYLSMPIKHKLN